MFMKSFLLGICSLALLAPAATPCAAQAVKSSGGKTNPVSPNPTTAPPTNPNAPSTFRGNFGLSNPAFRSMNLNAFAANQAATSNSIIASVTNSPFINQMQQGYLPGSNIPNPWALPNPYMSPFMNPMILANQTMNNPFMTPMTTFNPFMNPMLNNPFMNPMLNNPFMNPMLNNPFMNPMMNPMMAGNPFMNPMMTNPMMNPMMMNGGNISPFMMQPGMFGTPFGQSGPFGRGF
jgi:hypothetical protein